jgi:hypothetical protein
MKNGGSAIKIIMISRPLRPVSHVVEGFARAHRDIFGLISREEKSDQDLALKNIIMTA